MWQDFKLLFLQFSGWKQSCNFSWLRILRGFAGAFFLYIVGLACLLATQLPPIIEGFLAQGFQPFSLQMTADKHIEAHFRGTLPHITKYNISDHKLYVIYDNKSEPCPTVRQLPDYIFVGKNSLQLSQNKKTHTFSYDQIFQSAFAASRESITIDAALLKFAITGGLIFSFFVFLPPFFVAILPCFILGTILCFFALFSLLFYFLQQKQYTFSQIFKLFCFTSPYFFIIHFLTKAFPLTANTPAIFTFLPILGMISYIYFVYASLSQKEKLD